MMSYSLIEGESLLDGSLLGESFYLGEPDMVLFDGKVDLSAFCTDSAPSNFEDLLSKSQSNIGHQGDYDWLSTEVELDALEELVNNDFNVKCVSESHAQKNNSLPPSPANSYDSGVGSPSTESFSLSEASPSSSELIDDILDVHEPLQLLAESTAGNCFDFPVCTAGINISPSDSGIYLSGQLRVDFVPAANSQPCDSSLIEARNNLESTVEPDFGDVESIINFNASENNKFDCGLLSSSPTIDSTDMNLSPSISTTSSRKSRGGRKSKSSCVEEKKQRKRNQNKNAATRYRERKRLEVQEREAEYNTLDKQNKELNDKASQISREINYLKELMIEVYKIKGIIS